MTEAELKNKKIGVLMGGLSSEREVSLRSGTACAQALQSRGYVVSCIDVNNNVAKRLLEEKIEVAFNALHGRWGEDGCIQGLLESMFIPYTGSGVLASALGMDKVVSKQIFSAYKIPTLRSLQFRDYAELERHGLVMPFGFPVVVKPSGEGSSVGVQIARDEKEMQQAAGQIAGLKGWILVEEYMKGREIQVGVLHDESLGVIEVVAASGFYDYNAKYQTSTTQYLFPAPIPAEQYQRACDIALEAHRALGCSGASRSDLILDTKGEIWILEINTLPGMTQTSLLPKIAAGKGIDFATLCERLLWSASLKG